MIDTICDFLVGCGFVGVEFNVYNADADIVIGGRVCGRVLYIDGVVGVVQMLGFDCGDVLDYCSCCDPGLFEWLRAAVGDIVVRVSNA